MDDFLFGMGMVGMTLVVLGVMWWWTRLVNADASEDHSDSDV